LFVWVEEVQEVSLVIGGWVGWGVSVLLGWPLGLFGRHLGNGK